MRLTRDVWEWKRSLYKAFKKAVCLGFNTFYSIQEYEDSHLRMRSQRQARRTEKPLILCVPVGRRIPRLTSHCMACICTAALELSPSRFLCFVQPSHNTYHYPEPIVGPRARSLQNTEAHLIYSAKLTQHVQTGISRETSPVYYALKDVGSRCGYTTANKRHYGFCVTWVSKQ